MKCLFVLLNTPSILTLLVHHRLRGFGTHNQPLTFANKLFSELHLFTHLGHAVRRACLKPKRFFWRANFAPGVRYWGLRALIPTENLDLVTTREYAISTNYTWNRYYVPTRMTNWGLINKPFRQTLFLFLTLLLPSWPFFNKQYRFQTKFLAALPTLNLLPFYNTKIFKIYYL